MLKSIPERLPIQPRPVIHTSGHLSNVDKVESALSKHPLAIAVVDFELDIWRSSAHRDRREISGDDLGLWKLLAEITVVERYPGQQRTGKSIASVTVLLPRSLSEVKFN